MKKILIICLTFVFAFSTIGGSFSFAYAVNQMLDSINVQQTSDGILYTIGDEWELLETEQGTIFNKMPQNLEDSLRSKYLSNGSNKMDFTTNVQRSSIGEIMITFFTEQIAKLVWNGAKWVAISLVTGNLVPAAVAILAITIAGIATMTVAVIYMVGTYQSPSTDRVQATSGCISRDGGLTWICPYRFAL